MANPTPQAIRAAERMVRQQTGNSSWRYQSGQWRGTGIGPGGIPGNISPTTAQRTQFNAILSYFESVYPPPAPPLPPPPPPPPLPPVPPPAPPSSSRSALVRGVGALGASSGALVRGLRGVALGATGAASGAIGLSAGLLVGSFGALTAAVKLATDAANGYAQTLATLRANNGLSFAQGYGVTSRNSLFGISPERTGQIYGNPAMNPMLAGARGNALGFGNYTDSNFFEKMARSYQSFASRGPMGRMQANARLDAYYGGQAPDEVRNLVNLRPQQIQQQLTYGRSVQAQMGISPETLRKYAEEIPLATQRLGFALEQAKLKLAVEMAPFIERTLGGLALYVGRNAGAIAAAIKSGVKYMVEDFPPMLLKFGAASLRGLSFVLGGISTFSMGVASNARPILEGLNLLLNAFRNFGADLAGIAAFAIQAAGNLGKSIPSPVKKAVLSAAVNHPVATVIAAVVVSSAVKAGAKAVGTAALRTIFGGAAAGAGAAGASGAGLSIFGRLGGFAGRFVMGAKGFAASAAAIPVAVGTAGIGLGLAGYEGLRRVGAPGFRGLPSSFQIVRYYANRAGGISPNDAALTAMGRHDQTSAVRAARARNAVMVKQGGAAAAVVYQEGREPDAAMRDARAAFFSNAGQPKIATPGNINLLERLANDAGKKTGLGADKLASLADTLGSKADNWPAMLAELQKLNQKTEQTNRILDRHGNPFRTGGDVMNDLGERFAERSFRMNERRG